MGSKCCILGSATVTYILKIVYIYFSFSDQLCTIDSKIDENVETCSDKDIGGPLYIKEEGVGSNQLTPRDRCHAVIL